MTDYLQMLALEIVPHAPFSGSFVVPSSKSYTLRALLLAALSSGVSRLRRPLQSDDTSYMRTALAAFGVEMSEAGDDLIVHGVGAALKAPAEPVSCGLSGTSIRLLTAVAALAEGETILTGAPPLLRRPLAPLVRALEQLGVEVRYLGEAGYPPLAIRGPLRGGAVTIDASASSQFVSALLLAAPYAKQDVTMRVTGLAARPYVEMTRAAMADFSVVATPEGDAGYSIAAGQTYYARDYAVEYDASSAAHLLALAATTGGSVTIENAAPATLQADAHFTDYLAAMGCAVDRDGELLTVRGCASLQPIERDLSSTPDMTTPLSVVCAYADGESHLQNIELVRGHETDRLAATTAELRKLGVEVTEDRDGLRIKGGVRHGGRIATYHDHRMAMSFAAAGSATPGIIVEDPGCVAKTFPTFWDELANRGVELRPAS
jgi:3-phosphoshikimate 1-carboxyvinyltransferase